MIDILISIVDRLWALFNARNEKKELVFRNHIEPIFQDMATIHNDYSWGINEIRELLEEQPISRKQLIQEIRKRKAQLQPLRIKVNSFAESLQEAFRDRTDDPILDFLDSCIYYFYAGVSDESASTAWSQVLRVVAFEKDFSSKESLDNIIDMLDRLLQAIDEHWKDITDKFALAKLHLLPR